MSIKTIALVAAAVVLVAAAGWYFRDTASVRDAGDSVTGFTKSILPDNSYTVAKNDGKAAEPGAPHSLRKCVSDTRTIYTDEKCPAGSREAPISEGNVTVVPGQRPAAAAKSESKPPPAGK